MVKRKIFPGVQFGYLTAICKSDSRKEYWVCRCVCGNMKEVFHSHLTNNKIRSCGCRSVELFKESIGNRDGEKYGRWTILRFSHVSERGSYLYLCQCECGKVKPVNIASLQSGRSISCGCSRRIHGMSGTPEYQSAHREAYRELKKIHDTNWTWRMQVAIKKMYKYCVVCGSKKRLCVDHVKPLKHGNGLIPGNAVVLCHSCNTIKGSKMPEDLPIEMRSKILAAAEEFRVAWESGYRG